MDTFQRRLNIAEYVKERGFATSKELAERFGVAKQTIKHDIRKMASPDIASVEGRKGGYRFVGKRTVELNESEAETVRTLARKHQAEFSTELRALLEKIDKVHDTGGNGGEST